MSLANRARGGLANERERFAHEFRYKAFTPERRPHATRYHCEVGIARCAQGAIVPLYVFYDLSQSIGGVAQPYAYRLDCPSQQEFSCAIMPRKIPLRALRIGSPGREIFCVNADCCSRH